MSSSKTDLLLERLRVQFGISCSGMVMSVCTDVAHTMSHLCAKGISLQSYRTVSHFKFTQPAMSSSKTDLFHFNVYVFSLVSAVLVWS